jgi:hypothetical protein
MPVTLPSCVTVDKQAVRVAFANLTAAQRAALEKNRAFDPQMHDIYQFSIIFHKSRILNNEQFNQMKKTTNNCDLADTIIRTWITTYPDAPEVQVLGVLPSTDVGAPVIRRDDERHLRGSDESFQKQAIREGRSLVVIAQAQRIWRWLFLESWFSDPPLDRPALVISKLAVVPRNLRREKRVLRCDVQVRSRRSRDLEAKWQRVSLP